MSKAKASILAGMLAATIFVSGCANQGGFAGGKVAMVNGTAITKAEFDKAYSQFEKAFHLENAPQDQRDKLGETLTQMVINKLVVQTLLFSEAKKDGVTVSDADVKKYKQEKILSNPEIAEKFQAYLKQNNMSEAEFDDSLKQNLLLSKFVDAKGGDAVKVSDEEVKNFYAKNTAQFKLPERIHASHILVKAIVPQMKQELRAKNAKISDAELDKDIAAKKAEAKAKAEKLYAEIKADPSKFAALAKTSSDDTMSAQNGGDLGFMPETSIDPTFWAAAVKTPDGKMYPGVVETQFGYHIIKVEAHKEPHQQTFEEAKEIIRQHLSDEKKQAFLQNWVESHKATAKIDVEPAYRPKEAEAAPGGMMPGAGMPASPTGKAEASPAPQAVPTEQAKH